MIPLDLFVALAPALFWAILWLVDRARP